MLKTQKIVCLRRLMMATTQRIFRGENFVSYWKWMALYKRRHTRKMGQRHLSHSHRRKLCYHIFWTKVARGEKSKILFVLIPFSFFFLHLVSCVYSASIDTDPLLVQHQPVIRWIFPPEFSEQMLQVHQWSGSLHNLPNWSACTLVFSPGVCIHTQDICIYK